LADSGARGVWIGQKKCLGDILLVGEACGKKRRQSAWTKRKTYRGQMEKPIQYLKEGKRRGGGKKRQGKRWGCAFEWKIVQ